MVWIIPGQIFFSPWNLVFDNPLAPEILSHVIPCFLLAHINQLLQFFTHIGCVEKCLRLGSAELWCGSGPWEAAREPVPSAGEVTFRIRGAMVLWGGGKGPEGWPERSFPFESSRFSWPFTVMSASQNLEPCSFLITALTSVWKTTCLLQSYNIQMFSLSSEKPQGTCPFMPFRA